MVEAERSCPWSYHKTEIKKNTSILEGWERDACGERDDSLLSFIWLRGRGEGGGEIEI